MKKYFDKFLFFLTIITLIIILLNFVFPILYPEWVWSIPFPDLSLFFLCIAPFLFIISLIRLVYSFFKKQKHLKWKIISLLMTAITSLVAIPLLLLIVPILIHCYFEVIPEKRKLIKEVDHKSIAKACAQLTIKPFQKSFLNPTNPCVPNVIRDLKPSYISVRPNSVRIEMHGGFDHYGYKFDTDQTNYWELSYYTEGWRTQLVHGVLFPPE